MQIDSLTMFADKMQTISRTYIISNSLSYYPPFFYTILLSLLFTPFFLPSFSLSLIEPVVGISLRPIEHHRKKSNEIHSTIFHSLKKISSDPPKKKKESWHVPHSRYLSYSEFEYR